MNTHQSTTAVEAADPADQFVPPFAHQVEDLDVNRAFLVDLALKTISLEAEPTTANVAARLQLGRLITDALLQELYDEKLIEKREVKGLRDTRYAMLDRGWNRVTRLINSCSYIGPAPVSLEAYTEMIVNQVRARAAVPERIIEEVLDELVLPREIKRRLGMVATSGRSLFLSGPPGNGKTAMAVALVNAIAGTLWIPYAVEVDNQVIRLFDKHDHHLVTHPDEDYDRRWVRIKPPLVVVGGELTLGSLDLTTTESPRFYEAPFQMKANGGVLVVDDLGRQRCSARELLNRWIIPLEQRLDYLTLSTGKKIEVPFEPIAIFATNVSHADVADEAFMRRMGYRMQVSRPTPEIYRQIFQKCAAECDMAVGHALIDALLRRYAKEGRHMNACEPRDLILRCIDVCRFDGRPPQVDDATLDEAWKSYFGGSAFMSVDGHEALRG